MGRVLNLFLWELWSVEINVDLAGDKGAEAVQIGCPCTGQTMGQVLNFIE